MGYNWNILSGIKMCVDTRRHNTGNNKLNFQGFRNLPRKWNQDQQLGTTVSDSVRHNSGNDEGRLLLVPRGIYYFRAKRPIRHLSQFRDG